MKMARYISRPVITALYIVWLIVPAPATVVRAQTFTNPILSAVADPWIVFWHGNYYFTGTTGNNVTVWKTGTITGLARATPVVVWTPPVTGPNNAEIWGPHLNFVDGAWYIYYAADDGNNANHRMFVLRGTSHDPLGPYVPAKTGYPGGQLADIGNECRAGTRPGCWAIDGSILQTPGRKLYFIWSGLPDTYCCTGAVQNIYIAPMRDALHIGGPRMLISMPTRPWETRGGRIDEGTRAFQRGNKTFIVYSASASWTDDYCLGLLTNATGRLLDPHAWIKTGPLFEKHAGVYGVGGFTFVPSPDGTEDWFLYHAATGAGSGWTRDVRAQRLHWNPDGSPLLGYPIPESVPLPVPSGENGPYGWGGSLSGTDVTGVWRYTSPSSATSASADTRAQVFRGDGSLFDYRVQAEVRARRVGASDSRYGVYALYQDRANYAVVMLDRREHTFTTDGVVDGVDQGWQRTTLPRGFDFTRFHTLTAVKTDQTFHFFLGRTLRQTRTFALDTGQIGLVSESTAVTYRQVSVTDTSSLSSEL